MILHCPVHCLLMGEVSYIALLGGTDMGGCCTGGNWDEIGVGGRLDEYFLVGSRWLDLLQVV